MGEAGILISKANSTFSMKSSALGQGRLKISDYFREIEV